MSFDIPGLFRAAAAARLKLSMESERKKFGSFLKLVHYSVVPLYSFPLFQGLAGLIIESPKFGALKTDRARTQKEFNVSTARLGSEG